MYLKVFFYVFILFLNTIFAEEKKVNYSIFLYSTNEKISLKDVKKKDFIISDNKHLNYGFNSELTIWLKIKIKNLSNEKIAQILEINNPLLEHLYLFNNKEKIGSSGMLHVDERIKSINPSFKIILDGYEEKIYYLSIVNTTTALQFSIALKNLKEFENNDLLKQFFIVFFIGVILAFIIYSFTLFIYTKEDSYLYYCFYIFILLFQQLTYIGFLPLYMPKSFTYYDNLIVVPKVGMVIISAIIFARSFLKIKDFYNLEKIYKFLLYFTLAQILLISTPYFYYPEITVLTGLFFIFFNFYSAIYVYIKGNKQARFFIVGWSFLLVGYFLTIIDALGIISVMYFLPPLILILTLIEALFLLLAFIDNLSILQEQKESLDKKLYSELAQRNRLVELEVIEQTKSLKNLYKELHHRVKNNLQIILAIISLQYEKLDTNYSKEEFIKLENRIKAIAKTHEILYQHDNIETIDMYEYIEKLCIDINTSYSQNEIEFDIKTSTIMPLKEAVYIGIIINELLSNSIKHAKNFTKLNILLIKKNNEFFLEVEDNGKGYKKNSVYKKSLGLNLVYSLVKEQLNGKIELKMINGCKYIIRFRL